MQTAQPEAASTLTTLRILFFALITGVLVFAGVVVLVLRPEPGAGEPGYLLTSLVVVGAAMIVAWVVVGRLLRRSLKGRVGAASPEEQPALLQSGFFNISLVGGAMAEGLCFFSLVVYMVGGAATALFGAGLGLAALMAQIPTADRFHRFSEEIRGHRPA